MRSVLLVLAVIIFIPNAESNRRSCVQCTSNEDGDCAMGLRLKEFTKSRLEPVERSCSKYCPSLYTVVRECAYVGRDQHDKRKHFGPNLVVLFKLRLDKISTMINSGKRFAYYQCSNEAHEFVMPCNRASTFPLIFSIIIVAVTRMFL
ncbi:hypothetical protein PRIPAC_73830 [Pristionchus pacificus]|uniref:Uncharacterized protein n=1 Tax=Pristionchus pacificus TaxID=54126 RepID=A0A2A6C012_PRIPA|nr:hypothetical protein PRIPAC_73830 [Pristionchus pacificus]|eukprot:PDM71361.1 hypothetical protein PRIPAC_37768 [Pristionchus pacificus]